jgi:hypothetical protein
MEGGPISVFVLFPFERRGVSESTLAVFMTFLRRTFSASVGIIAPLHGWLTSVMPLLYCRRDKSRLQQ